MGDGSAGKESVIKMTARNTDTPKSVSKKKKKIMPRISDSQINAF